MLPEAVDVTLVHFITEKKCCAINGPMYDKYEMRERLEEAFWPKKSAVVVFCFCDVDVSLLVFLFETFVTSRLSFSSLNFLSFFLMSLIGLRLYLDADKNSAFAVFVLHQQKRFCSESSKTKLVFFLQCFFRDDNCSGIFYSS